MRNQKFTDSGIPQPIQSVRIPLVRDRKRMTGNASQFLQLRQFRRLRWGLRPVAFQKSNEIVIHHHSSASVATGSRVGPFCQNECDALPQSCGLEVVCFPLPSTGFTVSVQAKFRRRANSLRHEFVSSARAWNGEALGLRSRQSRSCESHVFSPATPAPVAANVAPLTSSGFVSIRGRRRCVHGRTSTSGAPI